MSKRRSIAVLIVPLALLAGCPKGVEESAAYKAACQGPPLRSVERRNQAMEDGYAINRQYDCIDKASFVDVAEQKAKWEAANTPEAIAQRKADREKLIAEDQARRAADAEKKEATPPPPRLPTR